jgi:hypothetical protein
MSNIRTFQNSDLPALQAVWIAHWSKFGPPPDVSVAVIEQAILSRTFFEPASLLVADVQGAVQAWCHFLPAAEDAATTVINAVCATDGGAESCESLLQAAESRIATTASSQILVGSMHDDCNGYAGLPPVGHGIGIHQHDQRTTSLLANHGYTAQRSAQQLVVQTDSFRMPVSRDSLQLRRNSRTIVQTITPAADRLASAMSHLDIERHTLVQSQTGSELAQVDFWFSDPEAQVMPAANAIVDLTAVGTTDRFSAAELYLIGSVIQSLAARGIRSVETAVDSEQGELIEQLSKLQFRSLQEGTRWQKTL